MTPDSYRGLSVAPRFFTSLAKLVDCRKVTITSCYELSIEQRPGCRLFVRCFTYNVRQRSVPHQQPTFGTQRHRSIAYSAGRLRLFAPSRLNWRTRVRASLNTVCPKCGCSISPDRTRRIDSEQVERPECGERFIPGKHGRRVQGMPIENLVAKRKITAAIKHPIDVVRARSRLIWEGGSTRRFP